MDVFYRNNSKPFGVHFVTWLCQIWVDPLSPTNQSTDCSSCTIGKATVTVQNNVLWSKLYNPISKSHKILLCDCTVESSSYGTSNLSKAVNETDFETRSTLQPSRDNFLKTNFASSNLLNLYLPLLQLQACPQCLTGTTSLTYENAYSSLKALVTTSGTSSPTISATTFSEDCQHPNIATVFSAYEVPFPATPQ